MRRAPPLLVLALLAAGCAAPGAPGQDAPAPPTVEPPTGGGWVDCPGSTAIQQAVPFRADAADDARGLAPGVHRLDERTFLWVWASYEDTLREDRISRLNEVSVHREPDGTLSVCTRVDLVAPVVVDEARETFDVAARFTATQGLPEGPVHVVVNWVAGCECAPLPRGNATARFP